MKQERKQYQGLERDQMFVRRFERNAHFDQARDRRQYVDSPMWSYCLKRFREYWSAEGEPNRSPPINFRDRDYGNEVGWFFPKVWVEAFAKAPEQRMKPLFRAGGPKLDAGGAFPTQAEFRRWELPAGTQIIAGDSTIKYPDGSTETWGALRRRLYGHRDEAAA